MFQHYRHCHKLQVNYSTQAGGMIAQIPFQTGTMAQNKKNELYRVSGNLSSCQANMTVNSAMTMNTPHIMLKYWIISLWEMWEWKCFEKNPTMDTLQFTTIPTDSLIMPLTFVMTLCQNGWCSPGNHP